MDNIRCITLEEHAVFPAIGHEHPAYEEMYRTFPGVVERLRDHQARVADMDAGHVDLMILSQVPGTANWSNSDACRRANDELLEVIRTTPGRRFGGFAALYMGDPAEAARELERTVKLGLLGALIDSHLSDGQHYDSADFWPVFEVAERLDVPLYIHPAPVPDDVVERRFRGNYSDVALLGVSTGLWGWHEDVGLHIVKLYAAGVFSRFPKLKIVLGHFGEMVPMMIDRINGAPFFRREGLDRSFKDVWNENIWVTTSGVMGVAPLEMLLKVTSIERVLYSIDTPFLSSVKGWEWVEEVREKHVLTEREMEMMLGGNAKSLFKL